MFKILITEFWKVYFSENSVTKLITIVLSLHITVSWLCKDQSSLGDLSTLLPAPYSNNNSLPSPFRCKDGEILNVASLTDPTLSLFGLFEHCTHFVNSFLLDSYRIIQFGCSSSFLPEKSRPRNPLIKYSIIF